MKRSAASGYCPGFGSSGDDVQIGEAFLGEDLVGRVGTLSAAAYEGNGFGDGPSRADLGERAERDLECARNVAGGKLRKLPDIDDAARCVGVRCAQGWCVHVLDYMPI